MKKTLSILIIALLTIVLCMGAVNAAQTFSVALSADKTSVEQGSTVVVTVTLKDFVATETGISALIGTFNYDRQVFETVKKTDWTFLNGWTMGNYNENGGEFTSINGGFMNETHEAIKVTLKVKENATTGSTTITFKELNGSDGNIDIYPTDQNLSLTITGKSVTPDPDPTPTPDPDPTPTPDPKPTPTPDTKPDTMPTTGVEDYILPSIAVIGVIAVVAFVRYNKMTK